MSRDEQARLEDVLEAIAATRRHVAAAESLPGGLDDPLLHDALLFELVVIGEAVKHLSEDTRRKAEDVPWQDVSGLRDVIAHQYFRIDITRILDVVERILPGLEAAVERLLAET